MKILYAIQGTGNGHISRAKILVPLLRKYAEVDILVSGQHYELKLPFSINYHVNGFGFYFGKKGGVDFKKTMKKSKFRRFLKEVNCLPVTEYDAVINDFEPVSAWAAYKHKILCIGVSHQASLLFKNVPRPVNINLFAEMILKIYAPADISIGFHFHRYDENIYLPLIRNEIRKAKSLNKGHYTVYLPAYSDEKIIEVLEKLKDVTWEVFSKHSATTYYRENIKIAPIEEKGFLTSMVTAEGVLCGAGFETPAEAIHLGKKLLVIPMKNQYEQQCNAVALKEMGIPVLKNFSQKQVEKISKWIKNGYSKTAPYKDHSKFVVEHLIEVININGKIEAELCPAEMTHADLKWLRKRFYKNSTVNTNYSTWI